MSGTASLLFPDEDLSGPLDPNSPEGKAFLAQNRAAAVGATSILPGLASLILPGQTPDGGIKNYVPGVVPQTYNFLSGLKKLAEMPFTGVKAATGLPGSDTTEQMAKDSLATANSVVPHMEPTNPIEQTAADMGNAAGEMGPAGLGGGLIKGLPRAAQAIVKAAVPAIDSASAMPVAAAITGGVDGLIGSAQQPQDVTDILNSPDDSSIPTPPIPPPTVPSPMDVTHILAAPHDITDGVLGQTAKPGLLGDQPTPYTLGEIALGGAAAIAVIKGGPRAVQFVDQLVGGMRDSMYGADALKFNNAENALQAGIADAQHVEAPLPVGVGGPLNRLNANVANSGAVIQAYTDAISANKTAAQQMRAETGLVNNASAFNGRVADIATTGVDKTSGITMPSIVDHWQRVADFTPAQTDAFNKARYFADELDNRTKLFSQAVAAKSNAPGALDDANFRVNFPHTDSGDLRAAVTAARADPVVAAELDTINTIHRQLAYVLQANDFVSANEARALINDHPNYLASTNTDGTLQGAFGKRDTPVGGGLDNIPIHASEVDKQHFTDLYRTVEDNSWKRNIIDKSLAYQQANPSVAQIFSENKLTGGTGIGDWVKPSAKGDTISVRRNGMTENYKVGNTDLLRDMTAGSQQSNAFMGAMNYVRNIFQSSVTGPLSALTGHFFPAVNAVRNTLLASTFRPEGFTYGPLTSLINRATGINPRGLLPDAALGTGMGLLQGFGAEGAKAIASMMDRTNPNAVTRMFDASIGPQFTDAIHQRMAAAWDTSIRAEMKANGALGSTGYASTELPSKQLGAGRMVSSPLNNLVPQLFRINGPLGTAQPYFVKMQNLYHEMQSIVNEAAQTHFYSTNKGRVTDQVLTHETRQLTGDPGTHGGGAAMRNLTQAIPYSNIIIQDLARMGRSFAETPLSTAYGVLSALGSLALGSAYTAKLSGMDATNHLTNELSNDQHAARVMFYIPGIKPENSPYIDLPQRVRWMYPIILQAAHDGLNLQADAHNPIGAQDAMDWLHSFFARHVTTSTMQSTLAGASSAMSPQGITPIMQAGANMMGKNADPTIYNQLTPGGTGSMDIGGDINAPGHIKGADPLTNSVAGERITHAISAMLGIAGSSIMTAATSIKANEKAHNDPMHTATIVGDQWLDRLKDSVPFMRGTVFSNNSALASKPPLIERTEAALDAMRPLRTWKTDAKYGQTDSSNGYTRSRGQELETTPLNDNVIPKDPTMQQLYYSYGAYASYIDKKLMPLISDTRKQMNVLIGSPADPETIKTRHNGYQRTLEKQYETVAGVINDADTQASSIIGKPASIMKMDFSKGPEQFSAPARQ